MQRVSKDLLKDIGIVTYYKENPFTGIAFEQNKNKQIIVEIEMVDGLKSGFYKTYDINGKLSAQYNYNKDVKHGKQIYYNENKVILESYYKRGDFIYSDHFDSSGKKRNGLSWFKNCIHDYSLKIRKFGSDGFGFFSPRLIWLKPIPASIFMALRFLATIQNDNKNLKELQKELQVDYNLMLLNFKKYFQDDYNTIFNDKSLEKSKQLEQYKILLHPSNIASQIPKGTPPKDLFKKKYLKIIKSYNKNTKDWFVTDISVNPTGIVFESNKKSECDKWINQW